MFRGHARIESRRIAHTTRGLHDSGAFRGVLRRCAELQTLRRCVVHREVSCASAPAALGMDIERELLCACRNARSRSLAVLGEDPGIARYRHLS